MTLVQRLNARLERVWPTASLRTYLFAAMLLATSPLVVLIGLQSVAQIRSDQEQIEHELARSAGALAQSVQRELDSSLEGLGVLAQSEVFQHGRIAALGRLLQRRPRADWDSIFLLDRDGSLVLDTGAQHPSPQALAALHELQRRVGNGRAAVSGLWEEQPPGSGGVAVAVPITQNGRVRYVLGARMGEAVWQRLASAAAIPAHAAAAVFDAQDRLIASSAITSAAAGAALPPDSAQEMHESAAGVHRASDVDGGTVYAAWNAVPDAGWRVQVALAAAPIDSSHWRSLADALATSGACLLLGLLLAALAARRVSQPLRQLAAEGAAGLPARVPVREIAAMRDALRLAQAQDTASHGALEAKAQEFETLFNSSPIGMAFAQDPACRAISHNAAMDALIGPRGSQRAGSVRVLQQGRLLAPGEQPLQRAAALGETIAGLELEIAVDGRPSIFVLANAVPLRDERGRPRGAISALVEITARKEVERRLLATDRQLRESQRQMELAQEAGHVGFFHYQFGADRMAWTPGQCKLFGLEQLADGRLRDWFERVVPGDRDRLEREFWAACALRREKQTLEYGVPLADGGTRWLSTRVMLQYDADGRAVQLVGVTVDMTDQVETERARRLLTERAVAARREAEAASRAKDEFLMMLGHELRNPLGAIAAAIDVLEAAQEGSAVAVEAREIIARQTRNLSHMMTDLLDVGRAIGGKIVLARQPVNLAAVAGRVASTLAITGEAREHPLEVSLGDAWIDGDAVRIEQVVSNLLTNAVKYTPAGRPIQLRVALQDDTAVLQVQDTGTGIPAALLPRVFDLFVQGERSLDRRAGGLGIGLTLVRRLVELHGGTVTAESSEHGACFTVRLPATAAPPQVEDDTLPPSRRRKVLVVEDNADVMAALRAKLELDGHTVSTAADGIEGLSRLLKLKPEVSIVDIGLPGLTGFELARHARAAGYAGRLIAMSGYGADRDAQQALVAGFDAYLVKPVDRQQLRASLSVD
jgi:signal transduction histidine kinase